MKHCFYCGQRHSTGNPLTCDHVIPRCKGGADHPSNYLDACKNCNNDKGPMTLEQYREYLVLKLNLNQLRQPRPMCIRRYRFHGERLVWKARHLGFAGAPFLASVARSGEVTQTAVGFIAGPYSWI